MFQIPPKSLPNPSRHCLYPTGDNGRDDGRATGVMAGEMEMFSRNYYTDKYEPKIAEEINELAPDYLFVGISSPRKERFILKYKHSINVGVFYGVGGAFDAKAGVLSRPPKWLQHGGMEYWLRVIRNPRVYGKRMPLYFKFLRLALKR